MEAALDSVTESESCPEVTLTFSSVQLATSNRDQNMGMPPLSVVTQPPLPLSHQETKFLVAFSPWNWNKIGIDSNEKKLYET